MIKIEGKKFDWFGLAQILKEHKGKLRQIRMLSVNELKKKYKGAALGPLWEKSVFDGDDKNRRKKV